MHSSEFFKNRWLSAQAFFFGCKGHFRIRSIARRPHSRAKVLSSESADEIGDLGASM